MREVPVEIAAYAAGFFDGEGCISFGRASSRRHSNGWWRFRVQVTNTNPDVVTWFAEHFGGKTYVHTSARMQSHQSHWKTSYVWVVSGHEADPFLHVIAPFVLVKRDELRLGLAWIETLKSRARGETLSDEERCLRDKLIQEMAELRCRDFKEMNTKEE